MQCYLHLKLNIKWCPIFKCICKLMFGILNFWWKLQFKFSHNILKIELVLWVLIFINLKSINSQRWFSQVGYQKFDYFQKKWLLLCLKNIIKKRRTKWKERNKKRAKYCNKKIQIIARKELKKNEKRAKQ
jgi:hypothetical protein